MKRLSYILVLIVLMVSFSNQVFADSSSANRQTMFNNVTDYFATLGKDPQDKKETIIERKKLRRKARLTEESRKRKASMKAKMKAQEDLIMRKVQAEQN